MIDTVTCCGITFTVEVYVGTTAFGGDDRSEVEGWTDAEWDDPGAYLEDDSAPWPPHRPVAGQSVPHNIAEWVWGAHESAILDQIAEVQR